MSFLSFLFLLPVLVHGQGGLTEPDGCPEEWVGVQVADPLRAEIDSLYSQADMQAREVQQAQQRLWESGLLRPISVKRAPRRPLFAIKTNLLFDAISAINVEVEVPIGKRWSIAGEWIFPWWLWEKDQYCFQVLSGNIEAKYWFGDRTKREVMTGWFAGFYMGGGLYDLEWKTKGYQGEFFLAAGLEVGYTHRIGRNLRLEYSLGVGYMETKYRNYISLNGGDILRWQQDGTFSWIGPTRAKVSFVWMLTRKAKKGGRR